MLVQNNGQRKRANVNDASGLHDETKRHQTESVINEEVVDISSPQEHCDLTNEDEDDIPYTHRSSRSTSPILLESDDTRESINNDTNINQRPIVVTEEVNSIADDDLREYFVITDDEEENIIDDDITEKATKTTVEQLNDRGKDNRNINTAKCAVCFDSPEVTCILPCGHIYCEDCVYKALSSSKSSTKTSGPCSLCRAKTTYRSINLGIFKRKKKTLIG